MTPGATDPAAASYRLRLFVAGVFFAEAGFYAVVSPLVPRLVRDVGLTTSDVGVLVAAYPAGVLLATVPAIALADRWGVRATTFVGLAILIVSTIAFGWAPGRLLLDAARLVQGMGGAVAWAGALGWLTSAAPAGRRGSVIGGAVGAALVGMVFGPTAGAAAAQAGRAPIFSALALVLVLLAVAAPRRGPAHVPGGGVRVGLGRLAASRSALIGSAALLVVGVVGGALGTLVPLLVTRREGGPATIALILIAGYLLAAFLNVFLGRLADRLGGLLPTVTALALAAALLPWLPLFGSLWPLAVGTVVTSAVVSGLWAPAAAMVAEGSNPGPAAQAAGVAAVNAAWAAGGAAGAVILGRLADAAGFPAAFVLAAGICAASALTLLAIGARVPRPARPLDRLG